MRFGHPVVIGVSLRGRRWRRRGRFRRPHPVPVSARRVPERHRNRILPQADASGAPSVHHSSRSGSSCGNASSFSRSELAAAIAESSSRGSSIRHSRS